MYQYEPHNLSGGNDNEQGHGATQVAFSRYDTKDETKREFFTQEGEWTADPKDGSVATFQDESEAVRAYWDYQIRNANFVPAGPHTAPHHHCDAIGCNFAAPHLAIVGPNRLEYHLCPKHAFLEGSEGLNPGPILDLFLANETLMLSRFESAN